MANLIEYIQSQVYENSTEDISGSIMQQVLTRMASDEGVVNVHTISGQTPFADYNNAQAARDAVPAGFKKLGLIITYKLSSGWYIDEFIGSATSGWSTASNWKCLGPISVSQNAETGKTTITIGSQSFDVATQPVSVSQNTSTGGYDLSIGGDTFNIAKQGEVNNIKTMVGGDNISFDVSLQASNVLNTTVLYLQPGSDYNIILNKPISSNQDPKFWINSADAVGTVTNLVQTIGQTRKVKISIPQDSVRIELNMRSNDAIIIGVTIQKCDFAFSGDDAIKELYIDPDFALYSSFEYMIVERGAKVISSESKWYEGILYKVNGQSYSFIGNIYTNETDALNACEGIKIYSNSDKTIVAVIDWSKTSYNQDARSGFVSLIADYNKSANKPIITTTVIGELVEFENNTKSIVGGNKFNVNLSLTPNVVSTIRCYLQKGQDYDIIVSAALSGSDTFWVVSYDAQGNYTILTTSYNSQRIASITVPLDSAFVIINCRSTQSVDIVVRVNKTDFATDTTEAVKELYIAPTLALYSNISGIWIARGVKIYGDQNKWYEGLYMYNGGNFYFACNIYNNESDARAACKGVKLYSNNDKTFVGVIDWSKVQPIPTNSPSIMPISDYNSLKNKPIISNYLTELSTGDDWINRYPELLRNLPVFSNKLYQHEDVNIVMLGDSFFAAQITCRLNPNAANLPPQCARNHTQYQIWERLCFNKPQYDRWDSQVNAFAEVGTFNESGATFPTIWDTSDMTDKMQAKNTGVALDRYSATNNASVSFGWDMSEFEKLNFIYRKSNNINNDDVAIGTSVALVTIDGGNGKALVYNGTQWVEANGYTFSMHISESGNGYAKTMPDIKLRFKKVTDDEITITISNSANDGLLYYWGTERWNGGSLFITNIARGGFRTDWLQQNIINDLGERDCDLLIYESPLTNDSYYGLSTVVGWETSIIQGGNGDWRDNANFKALSDNFTKFDLLCIVPHIGTRYIVADSNVFKPKSGEESITYKQYFDAIRGLMETLQVNYIPLYKDWIDTSRNEYDNYYDAGVARQSDDVHPNDKGCAVYAHVIEPAIEI